MQKNTNNLIKNFPAAAEYLSQIYLIKRDYGAVNNARLAERLNVSRPAVSQAIKRIKKLDLVEQDKYGTIELTKEGKNEAKEILKRHYLIEHLLVNILNYPWDKSDIEAMELQDKISEDLEKHLFEKLGRPETCPHGNPFPDTPKEKELLEAEKLINVEINSEVSILRITEEGEQIPGMLSFCFKNNLRPDTSIIIKEKNTEGLIIKKQENKILIPEKYLNHIRIKKT